MKLWQLASIIWALVASLPFSAHYLTHLGASPTLKAACHTSKDEHVIAACIELELK